MTLSFRNAKKWITKRVVPDYTNQLDLFSEAVTDDPAPVANEPARTSPFSQSRPRAPEQLGFGEWVPLPPEDVPVVPAPKPDAAKIRDDGEAVRASLAANEITGREGLSPDTRMGGREDDFAGKVLDIEPDEKPSRDFRITPAHGIGQEGLHEKARDNIAAIRLLKTLEAENRDATRDEQAVLALYSGWGAMPNVFGLFPPPEWKQTAASVKELLTGPEFESARASTPNAHFTSPVVIGAIWDGMERMGLGKGARILEPAMGVGHFFGLMPESMQSGQRTGVELDSITARIAKKLYPDSTIFAKGFEDTTLPDNYFDAVVGNVPFGPYPPQRASRGS